jgi:predicted nucleic acid-binding protein
MSLVVDASVVVKWFIEEPLHDRARQLLQSSESLHAPDLLVSEIGNIVWKKVIRGEIEKPQAQKIVSALRDAPLNLQPSTSLIDRALHIALSLKHPVYDCLYIACAEMLAGTLVTADERLKKALNGSSLRAFCRDLNDLYSIALSPKTIGELITLFKHTDATSKNIDKSLRGEKELVISDPDDSKLYLRSPAFRRLKNAISSLSEPERIDLLALGWLGQGYSGTDWFDLQGKANQSIPTKTDPELIYLLSLAVHFETGWLLFQQLSKDGAEKK